MCAHCQQKLKVTGVGSDCDQQKITQPGGTKMAISQLLLGVASSNLVAKKFIAFYNTLLERNKARYRQNN